jgi:hypothetical protein
MDVATGETLCSCVESEEEEEEEEPFLGGI